MSKRKGRANGDYPGGKRSAYERRMKSKARRYPAGVLRNPNARAGGFQDIENKFIDYELSNTAFSATWSTMEDSTADCISGVATGDTESSRDGRVMWINSVHVRGQALIAASEAQAAPLNTLNGVAMLILDTQTNSAQLTGTQVMDEGQTTDVYSFRNLQNTSRFKVLATQRFNLLPSLVNEGAVDSFASGKVSSPIFEWNVKFKKPVKVIHDGATATIASITDNSLHVIGVADSASLLLSYQSRVRFSG